MKNIHCAKFFLLKPGFQIITSDRHGRFSMFPHNRKRSPHSPRWNMVLSWRLLATAIARSFQCFRIAWKMFSYNRIDRHCTFLGDWCDLDNRRRLCGLPGVSHLLDTSKVRNMVGLPVVVTYQFI